ncbi:MAG: SHOCT domain-containing protein [Bacteroidales bacterium]|nr:SHOCT domain-containing protein [Bacteroidales bacterium]
MKQTCPDCKTIIEIDEKEFTPGEKIVRECPLCGNAVEFIVPKEKQRVLVSETTCIKEVEPVGAKKEMKITQKSAQQFSEENDVIQSLRQLKELFDSGVLNRDEFDKEKAKILGTDIEQPKSRSSQDSSPVKVNKGLIIGGILALVGVIIAVIIVSTEKNKSYVIEDTAVQAIDEYDGRMVSQPSDVRVEQSRQSVSEFKNSLSPRDIIIATFDDDIYHCVYVHNLDDATFYKYDLQRREKVSYEERLGEMMAYHVAAAKQRGEYIYIIANNNALGEFLKTFVIRFNTTDESFEEIDNGREASFVKGNRIKITDMIITDRGDSWSDTEVEFNDRYLYI